MLPKGVIAQVTKDARQDMFYLNGKVLPRTEEHCAAVAAEGESDAAAFVSFYEVLRCKNSSLLFSGEHFQRLCAGIDKVFAGVAQDTRTLWAVTAWEGLTALVKANPPVTANVRMTLHIPETATSASGDDGGTHAAVQPPVVCCTFVDAPHPTEEMYSNGCAVVFFDFERTDPNLKVWDERMKQSVSERLRDTKCYEAFLVRHDNTVSEGSRSNLFVVRGGEVVTPPDEDVLKGVTRQAVCAICQEQGISLMKRKVTKEEIVAADAVVITGTTPGVLPVGSIQDDGIMHTLASASNAIVKTLSRCYEAKAFGIAE